MFNFKFRLAIIVYSIAIIVSSPKGNKFLARSCKNRHNPLLLYNYCIINHQWTLVFHENGSLHLSKQDHKKNLRSSIEFQYRPVMKNFLFNLKKKTVCGTIFNFKTCDCFVLNVYFEIGNVLSIRYVKGLKIFEVRVSAATKSNSRQSQRLVFVSTFLEPNNTNDYIHLKFKEKFPDTHFPFYIY